MMYLLLDAEIRLKIFLLAVTIIFSIMIVSSYNDLASASQLTEGKIPTTSDSSLKIELVFQKEIKREGGTLSPIGSMAFLDVNDILLLNKNEGTVNRIVNGSMLDEPLLEVNVANKRERGMLGIAVTSRNASNEHNDDVKNVFLYYTESEKMDGSDSCRETYYCRSDSETIGNHVYKYELKGNRTSLILKGGLEDKIADNPKEIDDNDIIIGQGFGHITYIEVGPRSISLCTFT